MYIQNIQCRGNFKFTTKFHLITRKLRSTVLCNLSFVLSGLHSINLLV